MISSARFRHDTLHFAPMHNGPATTQATTMSPARLAAEAVFTATPTPAGESGEKPVVTLKRNRPVETGDAVERDSHKQHEQVEEARAPRTFRVEPPSAPVGLELEGSFVDGATEAVQARALQPTVPRKSRRKRHGDVTIIRPGRSEPVDAAKPVAGHEKQGPCLTVVKRRPGGGFVFDVASIGSSASREYASIMAKIQELERHAVAIKKRESSNAVRWIKRAIVNYELDAADLGLEVPTRASAAKPGTKNRTP